VSYLCVCICIRVSGTTFSFRLEMAHQVLALDVSRKVRELGGNTAGQYLYLQKVCCTDGSVLAGQDVIGPPQVVTVPVPEFSQLFTIAADGYDEIERDYVTFRVALPVLDRFSLLCTTPSQYLFGSLGISFQSRAVVGESLVNSYAPDILSPCVEPDEVVSNELVSRDVLISRWMEINDNPFRIKSKREYTFSSVPMGAGLLASVVVDTGIATLKSDLLTFVGHLLNTLIEENDIDLSDVSCGHYNQVPYGYYTDGESDFDEVE
jgi:hypothetical protein